MPYNTFEISTIAAFHSFIGLGQLPTHKTAVEQKFYKKKLQEKTITQACAGQRGMDCYYPIITYFCAGLEDILVQTPLLGTEVMGDVLAIRERPDTITAETLQRKQIDYLNNHVYLKQHKNVEDVMRVSWSLAEKERAAATVFTRTASQITSREYDELHDLAQEVDFLKKFRDDAPPILPTRAPARP